MKMRAIQIVVMNWLFVIKTYNLFEKKKSKREVVQIRKNLPQITKT